MSKRLKAASAAAIAVSAVATMSATEVSMAFGFDDTRDAHLIRDLPTAQLESVSELPPAHLPQEPDQEELAVAQDTALDIPVTAASLKELVTHYEVPQKLTSELNCLAGAVYFESKGESLKGQLAVARVVIARAESHRFPDGYCNVVYQPKQFSFVRGGSMPRINRNGNAWANAVRIAQIAEEDRWESPVEGALFFHARYVSPRWRLTRMAQVDNHIFYR